MASQGNGFLLGGVIDPASGERSGEELRYDPDDLTTHGVIVGMTGSGKTGLGVVLLEEALRAGIPALILDPKGDMPNLLLHFPDLAPEDFRPWVSESAASGDGIPVAELAAREAAKWRTGLESWGLGEPQLRELSEAAEFTVFTPGSTAGVPLNVVGDLRAPAAGAGEETLWEEVSAFVSGLLTLIDVDADPLSSREHVLLSNLVAHAWQQGRDLDLPALIAQLLDPPLRKLGVFEVDAFIPARARQELAMRLNALVAAPAFSAWTRGEPLDVERLLWSPDGRPRASILYLAHLSDAERQFVVSLVLSKVVTWMRSQEGSSGLRALLYLDEAFGFAPPTAEPPSKKAILTILKQARAFGVGFVLSTQNPVDLDYKAMSNAGTWMIGRLQTERDKARILEALQSAGGNVDMRAIDELVGGLGSRQFLLHNTRDSGAPRVFSTRWALSYLPGPITREQLRLLPAMAPATEPAVAAATEGAAAASPAAAEETVPLGADETTVAPRAPSGVPTYYLAPAASWASRVGADPLGSRFEPALVARVHMLFDEGRGDVEHREEWEAVFAPVAMRSVPSRGVTVDYDARDFRAEPPPRARFAIPEVALDGKRLYQQLGRDLKDHLHRHRSVAVSRNRALTVYSRVGESRDDFVTRCFALADDEADRETAKIRDRFEARMDRVRDAIARAEDRVEQLQVDTKSRGRHEIIAVVGDLLSTFLGGRKDSRTIARGTGRVARGASSRVDQPADAAASRDGARPARGGGRGARRPRARARR